MTDLVALVQLDSAKSSRPVASELFMPTASWPLLVFSGGTVLSAVLQRHLLEETQTAQHLVEFNVGEAFALAAILFLVIGDRRKDMTLAGSDITVLLLSALAWFVPQHLGVYLATTLAGAWILLKRRSDRRLAGIGQIWLALSAYELWGKLLFKVAYQAIAVVEVGLIYRVRHFFYSDLGTTGASLSMRDDWSIVILEGCSSFDNLSLALLIWISILMIAEQRVSLAAVRALVLSASLVDVINVARILAMLLSREAYTFWHDEGGSTLVALGSIVVAIAPTLIYIEGRVCRSAVKFLRTGPAWAWPCWDLCYSSQPQVGSTSTGICPSQA
ncbi:hypothetical protein MKK70_24540 [Methylobacterium sp. E-041]|uniref:hypothetical protein n=1 Tax=Methylobacterium sp. E-041 TaxID=2836573 RepID=UPI001FB8D01B|nr:hypothetical protein [Methylobacterium sp. E-041]MCJ2108482.1 hypothetical protein [Methylobacterium sp. E-041]